MKERPILFSAPMVRALLDGRKTQTRRVVKPQPGPCDHRRYNPGTPAEGPWSPKDGWHCATCGEGTRDARHNYTGTPCPYGVPGDWLWVRESGLESTRTKTFRMFRHDVSDARPGGHYWVDSDGGRYGAGYGPAITRDSQLRGGGWKVRPSIHMPRWASRLTLEVTEVRVERLQDISEADASAEGVAGSGDTSVWPPCAKAAYSDLWEQINGAGSWTANPWVWAVSFKVVP